MGSKSKSKSSSTGRKKHAKKHKRHRRREEEEVHVAEEMGVGSKGRVGKKHRKGHRKSGRQRGVPAAAPPIPVEGLSKSSVVVGRYPDLAEKVVHYGIETWMPDPMQDLNASETISFTMKGRKGRLWR
jgi:hypothetical protein